MNQKSDSQTLIELLGTQTIALLQNHWADILDCRAQNEITLTFSHTITWQGSTRLARTSIGFGRRIKDQVEDSFDTDQKELSFIKGAA